MHEGVHPAPPWGRCMMFLAETVSSCVVTSTRGMELTMHITLEPLCILVGVPYKITGCQFQVWIFSVIIMHIFVHAPWITVTSV